jgi:hypothetical protein
MVFGVWTVVLGGLCALYAPLMLLSQMAAARVNPSLANPAAMVPGMATYAALGVALIWLGIGSIQARRRARALLLIFSWSGIFPPSHRFSGTPEAGTVGRLFRITFDYFRRLKARPCG